LLPLPTPSSGVAAGGEGAASGRIKAQSISAARPPC